MLKKHTVVMLGERPPCTQKNWPFMMAARGRASKESMHRSYRAVSYLCRPAHVRYVEDVINGTALAAQEEREGRTLFLEGEVGGEVATLVVAAKHPEGVRVVDLESEHVKKDLNREGALEQK